MCFHVLVLGCMPVFGLGACGGAQQQQAPVGVSDGASPDEAPSGDYSESVGAQSAEYAAPEVAEAGPAAVSDSEVDAFAAVQIEVSAVQQDLQSQAQKEGADVQQLQSEFTRKASGIIENSSLSRERFDQIVEQVSNDPALEARLRQAIENRVKN